MKRNLKKKNQNHEHFRNAHLSSHYNWSNNEQFHDCQSSFESKFLSLSLKFKCYHHFYNLAGMFNVLCSIPFTYFNLSSKTVNEKFRHIDVHGILYTANAHCTLHTENLFLTQRNAMQLNSNYLFQKVFFLLFPSF